MLNTNFLEQVWGSEHPETLKSIANVGQTYCRLGRHSEGLPLLRECVAGRRKVLGEGNPMTQLAIGWLKKHEAAAAAAAQEEEEEGETIADRTRKRRRFR